MGTAPPLHLRKNTIRLFKYDTARAAGACSTGCFAGVGADFATERTCGAPWRPDFEAGWPVSQGCGSMHGAVGLCGSLLFPGPANLEIRGLRQQNMSEGYIFYRKLWKN